MGRIRLPRPWISEEQRAEDRLADGRQGAFARGMRQAAARDLQTGEWSPGPVPPARQVRRQERGIDARRESGADLDRAAVLARAAEQSLRRDREQRRTRRPR